jgi:hypothetical protein
MVHVETKPSDPVFTMEVASALECGAKVRIELKPVGRVQLQLPATQELELVQDIIKLADRYSALLDKVLVHRHYVDEELAPRLNPLVCSVLVEHIDLTERMEVVAETYLQLRKPAERMRAALPLLEGWTDLIADCLDARGDVERGRHGTAVVRMHAVGVGSVGLSSHE